MKILFLRFSSIGDIILTTPIVRSMKNQIPSVEIHYCTKLKYSILLDNNPYIDKRIYLKDSLTKLMIELRKENYDYIIDLHNNFRTFLIKLFLFKKSHSFCKINFQKWLMVNFKINFLPKKHIVDRYFETVSALNISNDNEGLDYFIPDTDEIKKNDLPADFHNGYHVFVIGGVHFTKKLPGNIVIEFCKNSRLPVVLLGGKEDEVTGNEIMEKLMITGSKIYNGCGKYNLNQSASIIRQSNTVLTNDTGLMHMAAAFKKRIISFWGNTIPSFGMYPYKTEFIIVENNNLKCRPCSKIGFPKCPLGHFKCMNELMIENILY